MALPAAASLVGTTSPVGATFTGFAFDFVLPVLGQPFIGLLTVADQPATELTGIAGLALLVVFGLVIYLSSVIVSLVLGAIVLGVSTIFGAGTYVGAIESQLRDAPGRAAVIGLLAFVTGVIGFLGLIIGLLFAVELGAPEPLPMVSVVPFLAGTAFVYVAATVGTIVLGSLLLARFVDGERDSWYALVVGALVVNVPGINFLVAPLAIWLTSGAMVDHWWRGCGCWGGDSGPDSAAGG